MAGEGLVELAEITEEFRQEVASYKDIVKSEVHALEASILGAGKPLKYAEPAIGPVGFGPTYYNADCAGYFKVYINNLSDIYLKVQVSDEPLREVSFFLARGRNSIKLEAKAKIDPAAIRAVSRGVIEAFFECLIKTHNIVKA